jgi:hypothetical protein
MIMAVSLNSSLLPVSFFHTRLGGRTTTRYLSPVALVMSYLLNK